MLTMLASGGEEVVMVMAMAGGFIAIAAIIAGAIQNVKIAKAKEESRREIAAYIAEGSISADDGRKLLDAGGSFADAVKNAVRSKIS